MKTKNLGLAAIAFVFAIGTAFASFFAAEDVYVHAKLKTNPDGPTVCVNTGIQCDNSGSATCTVTVPVTGGTQVAQTAGTFLPYRGTDCTIELKSTPAIPGGTSSISTIDRLVH